MSATSLQLLSGGRFRLGVGVSGPQVMEGWHGVRFGPPLAATRETIEIVRKITHGDRAVHDGRVYQLPLPDGPGRALRSPLGPVPVPIYVAALGPRNLELTGELAEGWIGNAFVSEAAARVPAELGRATNLLGTPAMVTDRLRLYRDAGVDTLQAKLDGDYASRLDTLAQLIDLVDQVSSEPDTATRS
jgi:alkanesulfonate monooxygenase SsuD/methylene tetrahydromethanopterin reductase-like flavin-dependent oxidoreductase (luciferase family)